MKEILRVENLKKIYRSGNTIGEVSFSLHEGEFLALIGESGCGKSTLARLICGLLQKTSGTIYYRGQNLENISTHEKRKILRNIQMIFQSPYSSLNPKFRVKDILEEGFFCSRLLSKKEIGERKMVSLLHEVGLKSEVLESYPYQLSGGQCQRVGIARALAANPKMIIADESLTALDMMAQLQILKLFEKIKKERKLSCLFISHDLFVVRKICDGVLIMKDGKIIEQGKKEEVFEVSKKEYTKFLLEASMDFSEERG
ncbi:MAG TPA: dipeptide/oligopeptide/nickel ABC transporter ATP-binding protein [Fusobacterium sp.]|uniref:ABC transporter ATP-binding protein n=1 Tax=Fusobacterium sp. TaxID=68766 RepID=UPI002F41FE0B